MSDIQEEQKRLYKKAKENDNSFITKIEDNFIIDDEKIKELYDGDYKKALYDVAKNERKLVLEKNILNNRINKATKYIEKCRDYHKTYHKEEKIFPDEITSLLMILKGKEK